MTHRLVAPRAVDLIGAEVGGFFGDLLQAGGNLAQGYLDDQKAAAAKKAKEVADAAAAGAARTQPARLLRTPPKGVFARKIVGPVRVWHVVGAVGIGGVGFLLKKYLWR